MGYKENGIYATNDNQQSDLYKRYMIDMWTTGKPWKPIGIC